MILTHPGLTKLTFMDYLLAMLRNLLRRKLSYDIRGQFVTVLPSQRPCILLYCRSDGCMSTTWPLKICAMLKISSGRRHMGTVPIKNSRKPPTPPRTVCNGFTVTQAMYIVVLSIGRLYEHHMASENLCDA